MPRIVGNTRISRNALINTSIDGVLESCQPRQRERERERERLRGRERDRPCNIEGPEITRYLGAANVYRNTPIFSVGAYFFHLSTRVCSLPPQESGTIRVGSVVTIRRLANMNY